MNKEQFEAVKDTLEATQQAVEGLAGNMQTFMETFKTPPADGGKGEGGEGGEKEESPAPAGEAQYTELKASMDTMVKAFNTMTERMEQRVPGTQFRENPNPAGEHDELL